jgi:diguanylate cyclase (GGDEF)-like protein
MSIDNAPSLTLTEIAHATGMLRQLKQHLEAVREDFMGDQGACPHVPPDVAAFHLRREMVTVERHIRQALTVAFGEGSAEVRQFRDVRFAQATSESLKQGQLILDRSILELEQKRLHLGEPTPMSGPAIDGLTDLYTEVILNRYLAHEIAWSQRHGEPFGLLLLRLPNFSWEASLAKDLMISAACILRAALRGYDIPCRVNEAEFAIILRQTNALEVHQVAVRITTALQAAARRILPLTELLIEWTSAVYPYDAESLEGLFSYAGQHWAAASGQFADGPVEASTSAV